MRIHHVAFRTRDLPRLESFYADRLGLEVMRRDGSRSVWLRAGDAILMLERAEADEPDVVPGSMEMLALEIRAEEYAEYIYRFEGKIEAETTHTMYVRDPDGRRVGLSHYPLRG